MRIRALFASLTLAALSFAALPALSKTKAKAPPTDSPEFLVYVMEKIDDMYRGEQSRGVLEMTVQTKHWKRSMALESWSLGTEYSLIRILRPKKEKGTATLKAAGDLFTYLSKTGRTVKITSGMMGGSWMGSHFTNDDLVRDTRFSEDFDLSLVFNGDEGGTAVYRFDVVPKPDTPVVWGKIEVTVRQSDLQPTRQQFFDEDGTAVRVLEFEGYRNIGKRAIPTTMTMRPLDDSGEFTQVVYKEIDFNVSLRKDFFSLRNLKSM